MIINLNSYTYLEYLTFSGFKVFIYTSEVITCQSNESQYRLSDNPDGIVFISRNVFPIRCKFHGDDGKPAYRQLVEQNIWYYVS